VRSVKEECLSHLILFGEASLRKAVTQCQENATSKARTTLCPPRSCSAWARSATCHLSRAPRRVTPVLQPRRMNILTKRDQSPQILHHGLFDAHRTWPDLKNSRKVLMPAPSMLTPTRIPTGNHRFLS
jgi:hypothetical protein